MNRIGNIAFVALSPLLFLSGCGGENAITSRAAMTLSFSEQAIPSEVSRNSLFTLRFSASNVAENAELSVYADIDGDATSFDDRYRLLGPEALENGDDQSVLASADGIPPGTYYAVVEVVNGATRLHEVSKDPFELRNAAYAESSGGLYDDRGRAISHAPDGSTVWVGIFEDEATFSANTSEETRLRSAGDVDSYVAQSRGDGSLDWVRHIGGTSRIELREVDVSTDGLVALGGFYSGTMSFNKDEKDQFDLAGFDGEDVFVALYNQDGSIVWAKRAGGSNNERLQAMCLLKDGSLVVSGWFLDDARFGEGMNRVDLISDGMSDVFMARYDSAGVLNWATRAGGEGRDLGRGMTHHEDGGFTLVGSFEGTSRFGEGEDAETTLVSRGLTDGFVGRYDTDGSLIWVTPMGGTEDDESRGVATLSDDSAVICGAFSGTSIFGDGELETSINADDGLDVFVARYLSDGTLKWVSSIGGLGEESAHRLTVLPDDSIVIAGRFEVTAHFGMEEPNETLLTAYGESDVFVARFNSDGTLVWAKHVGGAGEEDAWDVSSGLDGSIFVTGWFSGTAVFGLGDPLATPLFSRGGMDVFTGRFNPDGGF